MRLAFRPFWDDPTKMLYFEGQPSGKKEPDMRRAYLDGLSILGLTVEVDDCGLFETRMITALGLAGLGANNGLINQVVRLRSGRRDPDSMHPYPPRLLYKAYDILGASVDSRLVRAQAIRLAFKRGIFLPGAQIEQNIHTIHTVLRPSLYEWFSSLGPLLGEGLTHREIGDIFDVPGTLVRRYVARISNDLDVNSDTIVMLSGAIGLLPKDEEPLSVAA